MLLPNVTVSREGFPEVVWKQAESSAPVWPRGCRHMPFL